MHITKIVLAILIVVAPLHAANQISFLERQYKQFKSDLNLIKKCYLTRSSGCTQQERIDARKAAMRVSAEGAAIIAAIGGLSYGGYKLYGIYGKKPANPGGQQPAGGQQDQPNPVDPNQGKREQQEGQQQPQQQPLPLYEGKNDQEKFIIEQLKYYPELMNEADIKAIVDLMNKGQNAIGNLRQQSTFTLDRLEKDKVGNAQEIAQLNHQRRLYEIVQPLAEKYRQQQESQRAQKEQERKAAVALRLPKRTDDQFVREELQKELREMNFLDQNIKNYSGIIKDIIEASDQSDESIDGKYITYFKSQLPLLGIKRQNALMDAGRSAEIRHEIQSTELVIKQGEIAKALKKHRAQRDQAAQ